MTETYICIEEQIELACKYGDSQKVLEYVGGNIKLCDKALIFACKYGKYKIVTDMIDEATCCKSALKYAYDYGDIDIIDYIIVNCGYDYDDIFVDFEHLVFSMDLDNNFHVIKYIIENYNDYIDIHEFMNCFCSTSKIYINNKFIIDYLISKGADDLDSAMNRASSFGNIEMINYMIELGATNFDEALFKASDFYDECKNKNECTCGGADCRDKAFNIMNLLFSNGASIFLYDYYEYRQNFCIQFDCLYEMTVIKQYKQRLLNMQNIDIIDINRDLSNELQKYM